MATITLNQFWQIVQIILTCIGGYTMFCLIFVAVVGIIKAIRFNRYQKKSLNQIMNYARKTIQEDAGVKDNTNEEPKYLYKGDVVYGDIILN